jgi:hypothetical protein
VWIMAIGDKDIDEGKLAGIIEDYLSDVRFSKLNFAWHMGNKSPRIQEEFWETLWAFIQEMSEYYRRGMVDTKHFAVAKMCHEIRAHVEGETWVDNQMTLEL